jgi:uncharacterized protein YjbI with pentapeptide repeats
VGAIFSEVKFSGATLIRVNFFGASLTNVDFIITTLTGVDFWDANFITVDFSVATFTDDTVLFHGTVLADYYDEITWEGRSLELTKPKDQNPQ